MSDDPGSYEKVNYLLRLRKQIERKMIIELLQRLTKRLQIDTYHYIGFGSVYFADFILFHKYLHIDNMVSLEKDNKKEKRFQFNKPFDFIDLRMKSSTKYLNKGINWEVPLIIWFDYDYSITMEMIEDMRRIAIYAKPNDLFFITIDAESSDEPEDIEDFLEEYRIYIGSDIDAKKAKESFPSVLHRIVVSALRDGKNQRQSPIKISQLLNLEYKDTRRMYTYGCLFESPTSSLVNECNLHNLKFFSKSNKVFEINCPLLTPKEKFHLDSCINEEKKCIDEKNMIGLEKKVLKEYSIFYKYYPQFFESIY